MKQLLRFNHEKRLDKHKINNPNLIFLLKCRFNWMKKFTNNKKKIIELGSGNGFIKKFLGKNIITSDIVKNENIDILLDMNNVNKKKNLIKNTDIFIFNHSLHHSNNPIKVLSILEKFLKKGGVILINEPEISFFFKFFLKVFDHEGWDLNLKNSKKRNFWIENNATGKLLFEGKVYGDKFLKYKIIENELSEFLTFLNSSGNGVDAPYIRLSPKLLNYVWLLDKILVKFFPNIFALNRKIILKK